MKIDKENKSTYKYFIVPGSCILLLIILWLATTETLIPLYRNREYDVLIYNMLGIPVILFGTWKIIYGAWVFFKDSKTLFSNNTLLENMMIIRNKTANKEDVKRARIENTKLLLSGWRKAFFILIWGFVIILCGGIIINLKMIIG